MNLLTEHLATWIAADTFEKSGRGRSGDTSLYGVKKLRELILELAVRGLLVPQNAADEPASELLKKIDKEKALLTKQKIIRKPKELSGVTDDECFFDAPSSWAWIRLNDVGDWGAGATPLRSNSAYYGGTIPWFKSGELISEFISQSEEYITELALKECSLRQNKIGDVLIAMYGATIGKAAILAIPATTNQAVCACTPYSGIDNRYLLVLLKAFKNTFIGMGAGGAQPNISREKIIATVIPLPPTQEQQRIVAKVDELMAFCDQLEQKQHQSQTAHQQLVSQLLNSLTQSQSITDFSQYWQRINTHFDSLFTTEDSIEALKQSILQLAVMGKLVAQNPTDEPASELLKKIAAEKAKLVKEGKIKAQKPLPLIGDDEKPFDLPMGWEWVRLGALTQDILTGPFGSMIHKSDYIDNGVPLINPSHMINGEVVPDFSITISPAKAKELKSYELIKSDIVMARRGEMGRCAIVDEISHGWLCGTGSFVMRFHSEISRRYMFLFFKTEIARAYLGGNSVGTTMTNLNHGILNAMPLMIPSSQEQQRIVAKVDELMALCNQLKAQINQAKHLQGKIADVLVEQALV